MSYSKMPIKSVLVDMIKRLSNKAMETIDRKAPYRENQKECVEVSLGVQQNDYHEIAKFL